MMGLIAVAAVVGGSAERPPITCTVLDEKIVVRFYEHHRDPVLDKFAIVHVVDSMTGEVRECGNLSAMCLSLQPWTRAVAIAPGAPAALARHAAELDVGGRAAAPARPTD